MEKERKKPRMYFGKPGQEVYSFVFFPRRKRPPRMYFGKRGQEVLAPVVYARKKAT